MFVLCFSKDCTQNGGFICDSTNDCIKPQYECDGIQDCQYQEDEDEHCGS